MYAKEAYYTGPGSRLRRFTYRPDGLVALTAGSESGEAITRPIRFEGRRLIVNTRTARSGTIRVELQDADGRPLSGFALSDAKPLRGDELAATIAWSNGSDVSTQAGNSLRVRFVLQDAMLYSLRFE